MITVINIPQIIAEYGDEIGELYRAGFFNIYGKISNGSVTVHKTGGLARKLEIKEFKSIDN